MMGFDAQAEGLFQLDKQVNKELYIILYTQRASSILSSQSLLVLEITFFNKLKSVLLNA